jgi:hypothetical protein
MIKNCPVCGERGFAEFVCDDDDVKGRYTFMCLFCLKRYNICMQTWYMSPCVLLKGHEGHHQMEDGKLFEGDLLCRKS